jgi:rhomboid family GlyGly-CTERM serine protease
MMDQPAARWFRSVNGDGRYGVTLLLISAAWLWLAGWGDAARGLLRYQRDALAAGQWWRLLTAHWVHLGAAHAWFNVAGLALLWAMLARHYTPRQWLLIALAAMTAIDAGLWFLQPALAWYVGASGLLHGLWAAGAIAECRVRAWHSCLLLLALLLKLAYEQYSGASAVLPDMPVVLSAHGYGAAGGALAALGIAIAAGAAGRRRPL